MPDRRGNFAAFQRRTQVQIEDDEWQIAVAQKEVGGFEGLRGATATDPEKAGEYFVATGGGVKRVVGIDESDPLVAFLGLAQKGPKEEGAAGIGFGANYFGEGAFRQAAAQELVEPPQAGRRVSDAASERPFGVQADVRQTLGNVAAEFDDVFDRLHGQQVKL